MFAQNLVLFHYENETNFFINANYEFMKIGSSFIVIIILKRNNKFKQQRIL